MSIQRISIVGLLAAVALAAVALTAGQANGQDFYERYASWQGNALGGRRPAPVQTETRPARAPAVQSRPTSAKTRTVAQTSMTVQQEETGGAAEQVPAPRSGGNNSQRILGTVYDAPLHTPNYNHPWTTSGCASCAHGPTFEPGSDLLGTCDYAGGGPLDGGYCCGDGHCGGGFLNCLGLGGCGPCGACGGAGGGCDYGPLCCNTLVWMRAETLLWWRQGRDFPPLVTTDPATESSTTAGVLPNAHVLFGQQRVGTNMQAGGRIDIGTFLDPTQTVGIGDRVFGIGRDASEFRVNSNDVPVLAIPFFDFDAGVNDALLVAYPGLRNGSVSVTSSSSLVGNDVYIRMLLCRDCINRWDFITGWNWTRMADNVNIRTRSTIVSDPTLPAGTVLTTLDQFRGTNNFNGGILGLQWQRNCSYWTTQLMARMSLGNMREVLLINGESRVNGSPTSGGIFTGEGNIGRHARNEFTAITEVGANLGYRFAPCTTLNIGYNFMYFNDVLSPAHSIDTARGTDSNSNIQRPTVIFRHSDFWVMGLNLGITKEF